MKKTFLKMLPVVAAVLLATSCSKDSDGDSSVAPVIDTPDPVIEDVVDNQPKTVPFSIDVVSGGTLSKIGYADNSTVGENAVTMKFTDEDVTNKLKMTVSYKKDESTTVSTNLTLEVANEDGSGTFRGGWDEGDEPSKGTTLTATVVYNGESTVVSSTESVQKLMKQCKHTYCGSFEYINEKTVTLKDDRAYIEFDLEETQFKVYVNGSWYDLAKGKGCVAVEGGKEVQTRIKGSKTLKAGKIYQIKYKGYVDLGQTVDGKKILWKTTNETSDDASSTYNGSDTRYTGQAYYTFSAATSKFSTSGDGPRLPSQNELTALKNMFTTSMWDATNGGVNFSNDYGSVFFPAAGYNGGGNRDGSYGYYWSRETAGDDGKKASALYFSSSDPGVAAHLVGNQYSVRLVRGL